MREPRGRCTFSLPPRSLGAKKSFRKENGVAYIAAKRIPRLAAVVSLAHMCTGGNQRAYREREKKKLRCLATASLYIQRRRGSGREEEEGGRGGTGWRAGVARNTIENSFIFCYAHDMQTRGPPRPSTNPVSRSAAIGFDRRRAGQTRSGYSPGSVSGRRTASPARSSSRRRGAAGSPSAYRGRNC